ncbi:hypothetical protein NC653_038814 [Populus alba x Populus x berolinensis]|uniref:non-specific serine/threonine protein kinase n=1 Tax=Populus alba x Populus x berolinensis TaxID=444605 RepID=A0AAD6LI50_9ROSI|nr:hypothetical protein NC653_038814 [Populus alba x Populus x berolinensis]
MRGRGVFAGFPFWGKDRSPACGVPELELRCENNDIARMNISQVAYRVLEINQDDGILRIAREDSLVGLCSPQFMNSTFNPKVFESVEGSKNLTFIYGFHGLFTCEINDQGGYIQEGDTGPGECNLSVLVPVSTTDLPPIWNFPGWEELLRKGFEVRLKVDREACWECFTSSGACGIDCANNQTTCYCPNQSSGSKTCAILPAPAAPGKKSRNSALEIGEYHLDLVVGYGAVPVIVPRVSGLHMLLDSFEPIHGVLLCEGEDVDPSLYEAEKSNLSLEELEEIRRIHASDTAIDREQDSIELRLAKLCLERNIPYLAICRGSQVLNVASGGTLYQDIEKEVSKKIHESQRVKHMDYDNYDGHRHVVKVVENTPLHDWFRDSLEEDKMEIWLIVITTRG